MTELVDAKKDRLGPKDALRMARAASEVVVAKGKKVVHIDMARSRVSDDELLKLLLGPSGNLRAPTLRKGTKLLVGFDAEAYRETFGTR